MKMAALILILTFTSAAHARWFWEKEGELKCVQLPNGENCYWQENIPEKEKSWRYSPVKIHGYVLMRPVTTDETVNRLYVALLRLLETLSVQRELQETPEARATFYLQFRESISLMSSTLNLTPPVPKGYWSSEGPEYIAARNEESAKARCFQSYLKAADASAAPDALVEKGAFDCGFLEK